MCVQTKIEAMKNNDKNHLDTLLGRASGPASQYPKEGGTI
jgi:hypothetical protein